MSYSNANEITIGLDAIISGEKKVWTQISALMHAVNESGYWEGRSDSFSKWLEDFGCKIGLSKATLWRYYSAGNKYNKLRNTAAFRGRDENYYPRLEGLQDHVSPENLEILEKLGRVMSLSETYDVMDEIIEGTIRRKELRDKWKTFKPTLDGQTARGKGSDIPKVDRSNKEQANSLLEAMVLDALKKAGSSWIGLKNIMYYRLATGVEPDVKGWNHSGLKEDAPESGPNIIALVKETRDSGLVVHGIEIACDLTTSVIQKLEGLWWYCDAPWLAIHQGTNDIDLGLVPNGVGVIGVKNGKVEKLVEAEQGSGAPFVDRILKGLLLKGVGA